MESNTGKPLSQPPIEFDSDDEPRDRLMAVRSQMDYNSMRKTIKVFNLNAEDAKSHVFSIDKFLGDDEVLSSNSSDLLSLSSHSESDDDEEKMIEESKPMTVDVQEQKLYEEIGNSIRDMIPQIAEKVSSYLNEKVTTAEKAPSITHEKVKCCECGMEPIIGVRYKCSQCPDINICERCEASSGGHCQHVFLKIRDATQARFVVQPEQSKTKAVTYEGKFKKLLSQWPPVPLVQGTVFKTLEIQNTGTMKWPEGTHVINLAGDQQVELMECLLPGKASKVTIPVKVPSEVGAPSSCWTFCYMDDDGELKKFGQVLDAVGCIGKFSYSQCNFLTRIHLFQTLAMKRRDERQP
eukprot:TRINITY_DN460_c0_g1_i4.p1 TRINITY_DN460_c0_g1~~TRINITY_DN460_c0_g1_i4.p1  ORF type:complete len:351 (+),score=39.18 TRINITY_DN460_c0_g1_i4:187-1239(+)